MTEYLSVGWSLKGSEEGEMVERRKQWKRWNDKRKSATPAKIYKTEKIASRYGTPVEVFIKVDGNEDGF